MNTIHQTVRHGIISFIDLVHIPFKRLIPIHTFRYAACGGANVTLDILLFSFCYNFVFKKTDVHFLNFTLSPHIASLIVSFSISFCTGFYFNRYIVFKEAGLTRKEQLTRFVLLNIMCVILNFIIIKILVEYLGLFPTVSKIIATCFVVLFSYLTQTFFFFRVKA